MDKIAAVVLAAGLGTRMLPLTLTVPKPMLTIGGKNLIEHKLELLPEEVTEIVLVIGYLGDKIREYFGDEWKGKKVSYVEQKVQDGTAGALFAAIEVLPERFIVMMGDDLYVKEDVAAMLTHSLAVLVIEVNNRDIGGEVLVDDNGRFVGMHEAKHYVVKGFINTGMFILNRSIFGISPVRISPDSPEFGLPHTLLELAKHSRVDVVKTNTWFQVTAPEDLVRGENFLNQKK